ncbi:carboxypeptidase-like regulatory domain-containing protein [Echinicola sp. CAU 1574]|uniref:Carboxypeptidase-like regulatory domain-containing protein n=1 Tax=Echinicola arenosa TaxID=2774144 RepID=A0ABR9ALF9_9BACT|nr:MG2 domain-containing protein [Echinicola arenosa]MBD8489384.1 carboxypeptidase-like regulatory domain-containing protein [Echinicola arenosa]
MPKFLLLCCLSILALPVFSQSDYQSQWDRVEKLEIKNLPKSALQLTDSIYTVAKEEGNSPQWIKALIYKSKFARTLEEEAQMSIIQQFQQEIKTAQAPEKNILESMLAQFYHAYFQQNRWRFYNRSNTASIVDSTDFRTWDLKNLYSIIHKHFQYSLQDAKLLQNTALEEFSAILNKEEQTIPLRPSLFDFLAHKAIDFYQNDESSINQPVAPFKIDKPVFFEKENYLPPYESNSFSPTYETLIIYHDLIQFHSKNSMPDAKVMAELDRLAFIAESYVGIDGSTHHEKALKSLLDKYKGQEISAMVTYHLAKLYHQLGQEYEAGEDITHQNKKKAAHQLLSESLHKYPNSVASGIIHELKSIIEQQTLEIKMEKYLPSNQLGRIMAEYKNMDSLDFKLYPLSIDQVKDYGQKYSNELKESFIENLELTKSWKSNLINEGDFQVHGMESLFPAMPKGAYLITVQGRSAVPNDNEIHKSYGIVQVSDLALIQQKVGNLFRMQIIDRKNGVPISKAKISLNGYKQGNYTAIKDGLVTDQNGFAEVRFKENYYNISATVEKGKDQALFGDLHYYQRYSEQETGTTIKSQLFTDRSIYRPGQTVYFKGILFTHQQQGSEVMEKEPVEVTLYDVNDEEVSTLSLWTNEFGSFNGEFLLPSSGLTGKYYLEVSEDFDEESSAQFNEYDFIDNEHYISVEEYKRPTFEASFDPIKEEYQVNDSIKLKGTAKAFSGSKLTDAKVVYRVYRKVEMPYWYSFRSSFPRGQSQEIAHGELQTDQDGTFTIPFKAIPDLSVDKEQQPVFHYEVTVEVTDITGETRSSQTTVNVGYHALVLNLKTQTSWTKQQDSLFLQVSSTNLNGEFIPTKGKLKIFKLQAPDRVLRENPWSAPDYKRWNKEEFKTLFPHDPYDQESTVENWDKGEMVWETEFDTENSKSIYFSDFKDWSNGQYLVEVEALDKYGQQVKSKEFLKLLDIKAKKVAENQLLDISLDKKQYLPGDRARLQIGTAAKDLTLAIVVEKDGTIQSTRLIQLDANYKYLVIPVEASDWGGFVIHYSLVFANSAKIGQLKVNVPYPKRELEIETISFRDKIQPGSQQSWTFKIKGPQKDKVAAEMLASMYDASLDQFEPHRWSFNPTHNKTYYSQLSIGTGSSFDLAYFERDYFYQNTSLAKLNFTDFDWFGFDFTNTYANNAYLSRLREKWMPIKPEINTSFDPSLEKGMVKGRVTDMEGNPLPGVSIIRTPDKTGTVTDIEGNYVLKAKSGHQLQFSYIGYISTKTLVTGKVNVIKVKLAGDISNLDEIVVVGYAAQRKQSITGAVVKVADDVALEEVLEIPETEQPGVAIRGNGSNTEGVIYIIDGKVASSYTGFEKDIISMNVLKGDEAVVIYGEKAANGAIVITTHAGQAELEKQLNQVKARTDLRETALFYPTLHTDEEGNISFSFTAPESLTRWKLQLLGHTKNLDVVYKSLETLTQKELMVVPNVPRFLREGDQIRISGKISNLTDQTLIGKVKLELIDPITGENMDTQLGNKLASQDFQVMGRGNTAIHWNISIPEGIQAVQYKMVAAAGDFTDGEQNALPVLSNRMLVTETMPMWISHTGEKAFKMEALTDMQSNTLRHHNLALEVTSNPTWYAVQALPYLMEYPYECSEQTYSRFFANAVAKHIVDNQPRIKAVFEQWKTQNADALLSNLEKNQELKSLIIQETPWLRDAQSESEQKQRIALLFDLNKMNYELSKNINKLQDIQFGMGSFPWFKGSQHANRRITQYIITGLTEMRSMGIQAAFDPAVEEILKKGNGYLDQQIKEDYKQLQAEAERIKKKSKNKAEGSNEAQSFLNRKHIQSTQVQYLYLRSMDKDRVYPKELKEAINYYQAQAKRYWAEFNLQDKAHMVLISHRLHANATKEAIMKSLVENSISSPELGMYWKANKAGWLWSEAPIETQSLLIRAFAEVATDYEQSDKQQEIINQMKIWLLKHKQTNRWSTTKATASAVQALLLEGTDWLSITKSVNVRVGTENIYPDQDPNIGKEAGTGYFKKSWHANEIKSEMGNITFKKETAGVTWGALYWQYFEDLNKINSSTTTPLKIKKKLFVKTHTDSGEVFEAIDDSNQVRVGDLIKVRIEIKVDRDMDFVHLKDMRAAGFEPINVLSSYKYQDGLGYYESTRDASTNFFFEQLNKGIYVFEYELRANNPGIFSNGISTIQCMYAPEFSSHSEGIEVEIIE